MILSDDEIIIQVIKGNEEALGLLFLYYEKHFRILEIKIRKYCYYYDVDYEDIRLMMMENMMEIIKIYDKEISSFFAFWSIVEHRHLLNSFRKIDNTISFVSMDEVGIDFFSYLLSEDNVISDYSLKEAYQRNLNKIEYFYSDVEKQIVILWSKGYTYIQISEMLKIKLSKVCYIITKCLTFLKKNK